MYKRQIYTLPGYSQIKGIVYKIMVFILKRRIPEPPTTPLSFLIKDEASLLHIGDAHRAPSDVKPDILCLPWRRVPPFTALYKKSLVYTVNQTQAPYVIPIHNDMPSNTHDPIDLRKRLDATILDDKRWYSFHQHQLVSPKRTEK